MDLSNRQSSHYKPHCPPTSQFLSMVSVPIKSMPPPPRPTGELCRSTRQRRPTPRPCSNPSDSSANQTSSQRKRKRGLIQSPRPASVSAPSGPAVSRAKGFPESVKNRVRNASSGEKCWHCGDEGRDVAHVIFSSESDVSALDPFSVPRVTR